jgi:AcrR family transcriptional regulator
LPCPKSLSKLILWHEAFPIKKVQYYTAEPDIKVEVGKVAPVLVKDNDADPCQTTKGFERHEKKGLMKDAKYIKILDAVVRLEVTKGHLRWKMAELSRVSGVQRTLVYYYFGKSKEAILAEALKTIGDEFFGLSPERISMWKEGRMKESILATRARFKQAPHVPQFFFHWRHQPSEVQTALKLLEKRFRDKVKAQFPKIRKDDEEAVYAVFFGLVLVPDLKESVLDRVLSGMKFPR